MGAGAAGGSVLLSCCRIFVSELSREVPPGSPGSAHASLPSPVLSSTRAPCWIAVSWFVSRARGGLAETGASPGIRLSKMALCFLSPPNSMGFIKCFPLFVRALSWSCTLHWEQGEQSTMELPGPWMALLSLGQSWALLCVWGIASGHGNKPWEGAASPAVLSSKLRVLPTSDPCA